MIPSPYDGATERRASYRIPSVEQRVARLKIADREFLTEILDESADGFAVVLLGTLDCHVGQVVRLQAGASWVEARVMNVSIAYAAQADEPDDAIPVACTRLGLRRVRDLPAERRRESWLATLRRGMKRRLTPLRGSWPSLAAIVVAMLGGAAFCVWALEYPLAVVTLARREMPYVAPAATGGALSPRYTRKLRVQWPRWRWSDLDAPLIESAAKVSRFSEEIVRRTRPDALLHPETITKLALTDEQLAQLRLIHQAHARGATATERHAAEQALKVLTAEQLAAWHQLSLGNADPAGDSP